MGGGSALRSRARKSDLLQVYRNERKSAPNPNSVAFTYVDTIVDRLIGSGRTKHEAKEVLRTIVQKLAKYDEIFERFLDYAEDSAKRHFSVGPQFYFPDSRLHPKPVVAILESLS